MKNQIKLTYLRRIVFLVMMIILVNTTTSIVSAADDEPIIEDYSLPGQSWTFIEKDNFTVNAQIKYEWRCIIEVQGVGVTKADYLLMQSMSLSERSSYFLQLNYYEGLTDAGKLTADTNGTIYFIFFNPEVSQTTLTITYTYRTNLLEPWAIGLIATIVSIIVLSIALYIAIKLRQKMIQEALEEQEQTPEQRYLG